MDIGSNWNNWTITDLLGEGSFGKVYRIERNEFGYSYKSALKVIRIPQSNTELKIIRNEGMTDESITMYFRSMVEDIVSEFALMSELRGNSNIVSYEDHSVVELTDEFGWEIYIRMELLTPLFDYLEDNSFTIRDVIKLGIDMCKALELCQKYNIIHRDIKPENIFVSGQKNFKLGDFGIARKLEKTSSGMSKKGTYSYMAPEVFKGQSYNSTVDIYSLGIVLYRFLNNNRTPFLPPYPEDIKYSDKENANIMRMSGEQFVLPSNATGRLGEIILKACAYNPKDRYESPLEMRRALESIAYTEEESRIIYPYGDFLEVIERSDMDTVHETTVIEDRTVSMFGSIEHTEEKIEEESLLIDSSIKTADNSYDEITEKLEQEELINSEIIFEEKGQSNDYSEDNGSETDATSSVVEKQTIESGSNPNKRGKALVAIAVLALATVFLCFFIYNSLHQEVPGLVGINETEAKEAIEEVNLEYVEKSREFSDDYQQGVVISQSVEKGTVVKNGTAIEVVISKGEPIKVPSFRGKTASKAKSAAEEKGLKLEEKEKKYSGSVPKGEIVSQDIKAGTDVEKGTKVCVVISKGKEQIKVPNVEGKKKKKAKQLLKQAHFRVKTDSDYSDSVSEGVVISQSKKAGKYADKNSTVVIVISLGERPSSDNSSNDYNSGNEDYRNDNNNNRNNNSRRGGDEPNVPSFD